MRGMSYQRLEELGGIQWPCPTEDHPGSPFLHGRLWEEPAQGPPAPFSVCEWQPPIDELSDEFPIRLTTGRRLDSYNTGVQSSLYSSPLRRGETLDLSPEDAAKLDVEPGEVVRVSSRRGSIEAPVRLDTGLRPGLAFMTFHFPDEIDVNVLTIDATDPKSGTAEFKATAVRVEKLNGGARQAAVGGQPRGRRVAWTFASSTPSPPRPSARPSTRSSARRVSHWAGADRVENGHSAHGGHAARARAPPAAPTLHALHEHAGWISPGALNYIARRLTIPPADVYGVATFYALFSVEPRPPRVLHVCDDVVCRCAGSDALIATLDEKIGPARAPTTTGRTWQPSPCLGQCDRAPAALLVAVR